MPSRDIARLKQELKPGSTWTEGALDVLIGHLGDYAARQSITLEMLEDFSLLLEYVGEYVSEHPGLEAMQETRPMIERVIETLVPRLESLEKSLSEDDTLMKAALDAVGLRFVSLIAKVLLPALDCALAKIDGAIERLRASTGEIQERVERLERSHLPAKKMLH